MDKQAYEAKAFTVVGKRHGQNQQAPSHDTKKNTAPREAPVFVLFGAPPGPAFWGLCTTLGTSLLSPPLGAWADRSCRKTTVTLGVAAQARASREAKSAARRRSGEEVKGDFSLGRLA